MKAGSDSLIDSPGLQLEVQQVIFLQPEKGLSIDKLLWWFLWSLQRNLYQVYIKLTHFSLHGLGNQAALVPSDSKSMDGKMLVWRATAKYLLKLEKFRIQFSL